MMSRVGGEDGFDFLLTFRNVGEERQEKRVEDYKMKSGKDKRGNARRAVENER